MWQGIITLTLAQEDGFDLRLLNERVLITGADGFIGSHLVEALVRDGFKVRAFVFYNSFNTWGWLEDCEESLLENIEVVSGDIRDSYAVLNAMEGCHYVIHLAALIAIPFSYVSPESYIDTNIKGTLNILQASKKLNIKKLVHTSTSEVYGTAKFVPISEEHPLQGQSPYSASKIGADQLVQSFFSSFGTPAVTIRPFNTYGPRQSARAVIPTIITQIANKDKNLKLGSLSPTRDFNFIEDTVSGFLLALKADKVIGEVINLGSNFEISIGETANMISQIMDSEINIDLDFDRTRPKNSEVERLWADNSKALSLLDWSPKYAGLEGFKNGLIKTIDWFSKDENLAKYKSRIYNI